MRLAVPRWSARRTVGDLNPSDGRGGHLLGKRMGEEGAGKAPEGLPLKVSFLRRWALIADVEKRGRPSTRPASSIHPSVPKVRLSTLSPLETKMTRAEVHRHASKQHLQRGIDRGEVPSVVGLHEVVQVA